MRIIAADDERIALESLVLSIKQICPDEEIVSFRRSAELLKYIDSEKVDVSFLDIRMPGTSGVELAQRLKEHNPQVNVIFVTGYEEYSSSAMELHASGYILKPVTPEKISRELCDLRYPVPPSTKKPLLVKCFGNFEVMLPDGSALHFERSKAKELFAYLVYRRGTSSSIREIAATIFEDNYYDKKQQVYIQKIISSMMKTLRECGAEEVISKTYNSLSVIPEKIDCDYYRFMNAQQPGTPEFSNYTGEFMAQYSWAEFVNGYLDRILMENK